MGPRQEAGERTQLRLRPASAASTSSQDWKGAASVDRVRRQSSSIRREVGFSSRDAQPGYVKIVRAGGIAAGDPRIVVRNRLGLFVVQHAPSDLARGIEDRGLMLVQSRACRSARRVRRDAPANSARRTGCCGFPCPAATCCGAGRRRARPVTRRAPALLVFPDQAVGDVQVHVAGFHSFTGVRMAAPLPFSSTTTNLASSVLLALRPTT